MMPARLIAALNRVGVRDLLGFLNIDRSIVPKAIALHSLGLALIWVAWMFWRYDND
jgi:hypothetical protein